MAEKSVDDRALDVATQVLHHIDTMYPGMWKGVPASARTSLWNTIISAVNVRFRPAVETPAHLPPDGTVDGDGVWRGGLWHPNRPDQHAMLANDPAALQRVLERHVRWREDALRFLRQVVEGRGTEDEWPALAEFLERSDSRMVKSSPEETGACNHHFSELLASKDNAFEMRQCLECAKIFRVRLPEKTEAEHRR